MVQSNFDFPVVNTTGTTFRNSMRTAFQAVLTNNQGDTEPPETFPYMRWADTDEGVLKERNSADTAWVVIGDLGVNTDNPFLRLADQVYPVGTIYSNTTNPNNPSTYLGFGTWQVLAPGRVLVGIDSNDADFDTAGSTGGLKSVSLTAENNGPHTHGVTDPGHVHPDSSAGGQTRVQSDASSTYPYDSQAPKLPTSTATTGITIGSQGSGTPHNNLQPYYVTYRWVRTA